MAPKKKRTETAPAPAKKKAKTQVAPAPPKKNSAQNQVAPAPLRNDVRKKTMRHRTLHGLILNLQAIERKYGDLDVVYSKDDEGNDFGVTFFPPSVGFFLTGYGDFSGYKPVKYVAAGKCGSTGVLTMGSSTTT